MTSRPNKAWFRTTRFYLSQYAITVKLRTQNKEKLDFMFIILLSLHS